MKTTPVQQRNLMIAMDVSTEDLEFNRIGVLSDTQRHKIRRSQIWGALGWWVLAFIGALPFILPNRWPLDFTGFLVNVGMIVVGLSMAFWRQFQIGQALKENKVSVVTGAIQKTCRTENKHKVYRAVLDEKKFKVNKDTYDWLVEDTPYSFYYVPQTNELLSIGLPLTDEEAIRFSYTKPYDLEKAKRLSGDIQDTEENYLEEYEDAQSQISE